MRVDQAGLPEILTEVQLENILQATDAVQIGHHWRLQFLLDLSLTGVLVSFVPASSAPANHSGEVVIEHSSLGFSVLSQTGPADSRVRLD